MTDFISRFDPDRLGIPNNARSSPDKPALIMNDMQVTFGELELNTNALANHLLEIGLNPGDRMAVLMHNSPEMVMVWSAAGKIGITPISINYRFKGDEVAFIINDSGAKVLIYGDEFQLVVEEARPEFISSSMIYICIGPERSDVTHSLEAICQGGWKTPPAVDTQSAGVSSSIIYTSGTTGKPKCVFKKSSRRLNTLLGYATMFESTHEDIHLVAAPMYRLIQWRYYTKYVMTRRH